MSYICYVSLLLHAYNIKFIKTETYYTSHWDKFFKLTYEFNEFRIFYATDP